MGFFMSVKSRVRVVILLVAFICFPLLAMDPPGVEIRFHGYVQYWAEPPCTPDIRHHEYIDKSGAIKLDTINISDLSVAGSVAGDTWVTFGAFGCTGFDVNHMWVYFTSPFVDSDGRVIPHGHSQVRFEIVDDDSGNRIKVGQGGGGVSPDVPTQGTAATFSGSVLSNQRTAEKTYVIRYYAQQPVTVGGYPSAAMTANFRYY